MKNILQSLVTGSMKRIARNADLPGSTEAGEPAEKAAAKPAAKKAAKKAAKPEHPLIDREAQKKAAKPATKKAAKPEKGAAKAKAKPATSKESKAAKVPGGERKPRVDGRVDLVYRSGPERAIAIKVAEKHGFKPEKGIKVDNCTVGYVVNGAKAESLKTDYLTRREAWRKDQDALTLKHIGKLD